MVLLSRLWFFLNDANSKRSYPARLWDSLGWNGGLCRVWLWSYPMDFSSDLASSLMFI